MSNDFAHLLDTLRAALVVLFLFSLVLSIGDIHGSSNVTVVGLLGFPELAGPMFYTMVGSLALLFAVTAARRRITELDASE